MPPRAHRTGYFALTALNTLASQYYLNYLFFFLRDRFGFDNRDNLWVAALHGGIYIGAAWFGGRFAERHGYRTSLAIGFGGLAATMAGAWWLSAGAAGTLAMMCVYTIVLLFIWPALEALTTADEPPERLPHVVGLYNFTWSASAALAYFTGGPLYDWLGEGALFGVPGAIFLAEFLIVTGLMRAQPLAARPDIGEAVAAPGAVPAGAPTSRDPRVFLRLAWLANPLSYVAIYTLFAVMPGIAAHLGLSPTRVGLFCSVWLFARMTAFVVLWRWTGWHYRFRWLATSYVLLGASFVAILVSPTLAVVVAGQVVFGAAAGLLYYSSLFYAMDLSDARAEHGGLHEAGIGAGICAGPAVGALSLHLFPGVAHAGAYAVAGLLICGFGAMLRIWRTSPPLGGPAMRSVAGPR